MPRLLELRPGVSGVYCQRDLVAVGALAALRTTGRRLPEECSVVGCDGLDSAAYTTPPLTTVRVPFYEIGVEAMRLLLKLVDGGAPRTSMVMLPVHLIRRGSTAPASSAPGRERRAR